jgi:hypothetical protein
MGPSIASGSWSVRRAKNRPLASPFDSAQDKLGVTTHPVIPSGARNLIWPPSPLRAPPRSAAGGGVSGNVAPVAGGSWSVRRATSRPLAPLGVTTTSCHSERSEESALAGEPTTGSTTSRRRRRGMDPERFQFNRTPRTCRKPHLNARRCLNRRGSPGETQSRSAFICVHQRLNCSCIGAFGGGPRVPGRPRPSALHHVLEHQVGNDEEHRVEGDQQL